MIHKLSGIHETVDFREDEQVCLYYNDEYENYPPHWHTSFEVLMPIRHCAVERNTICVRGMC